MRISTAGIKLIACGALVAVGLTIGSGTAHAAPVLPEPTADQCKIYAQAAIDEGEGETLAEELVEHGLDPTGCPPAPVVLGTCVLGHNTVTGEHCYTEGYSDPKDRPSGYPTPNPGPGTCVLGHNTVTGEHCYTPGYSDPKDAPKPPVAGCDTSKLDGDGDYDCTPFPPAVPKAPSAVVDDSSSAPVADVKGVTVSNAAPAVAAAVTPAKAATLSTPVLAAAATPAATTVKALPLTGGDITGIVLLAFAGLGIGGALLLIDKRRRTA
jgi:LPXTG-motif cell wall-anchored protein